MTVVPGIACEPWPGLRLAALAIDLRRPIGELEHLPGPPPPVPAIAADLQKGVRTVLRQRGYRPAGRGKPSSEYLAQAAGEGRWPVVNAAVDAANLASLTSGLPISLIDAGLAPPPWRVRAAAAGERYVFHHSGQEIDLAGLPCLCDRDGPCANAVKDSARTKTNPASRQLLAIVWGIEGGESDPTGRVREALRAAFVRLGAEVHDVALVAATAD